MNATRVYKGIAIFGAPGSGKTTIARLLRAHFPGAQYIEAFDAVINPAASIKEKLSKDEGTFVRSMNAVYGQKIATRIPRDNARNFFTYLKNRYTPSVIAKTLISIHEKRFVKKLLIIAGIRGYGNAAYFKKSGYFVVYLKTPNQHGAARVSKRENFSQQDAEKEQQIEERLFSTNKVEKIAHLTFDTAQTTQKEVVAQIKALVEVIECKKCVNTSTNLANTIGASGLCDACERYEQNFSKAPLAQELQFLLARKKSGKGKYDAMVGISGGKDSTATLEEVRRMGFTPLAFSLDTGYYPAHIFPRAAQVATKLGVDYERIDARQYMRPVDRVCFQKTAALYDERDSFALQEKFRKWYREDRRHYSVKCRHAIPFVRTCQLCRRLIVRAYYGEAQKHGVSVVILGMNEWAGLSQDSASKKYTFSAIRKLQPFKNKLPVYIVHLPFLLQRTIQDTAKILKELGWVVPRGEQLIESNANSCLFARAAEEKAERMLGFHPDSTRLAREVTVGFITKKQAKLALAKAHRSKQSVRQVLMRAGIL